MTQSNAGTPAPAMPVTSRLAAAGYATSRKELVGRRPRTCWQITDAGREALRSWLAQPPTSPPVVEFEGMAANSNCSHP